MYFSYETHYGCVFYLLFKVINNVIITYVSEVPSHIRRFLRYFAKTLLVNHLSLFYSLYFYWLTWSVQNLLLVKQIILPNPFIGSICCTSFWKHTCFPLYYYGQHKTQMQKSSVRKEDQSYGRKTIAKKERLLKLARTSVHINRMEKICFGYFWWSRLRFWWNVLAYPVAFLPDRLSRVYYDIL